jgi:hypothetical protein
LFDSIAVSTVVGLGGSHESRYVELVRSFPVLGGHAAIAPAPGVELELVDLELLDRWASHDPGAHTNARGPYPGDGARCAAAFVLNVWSSRHPWRVGRFDLFQALRAWDHEQLAAFAAYIRHPFFP